MHGETKWNDSNVCHNFELWTDFIRDQTHFPQTIEVDGSNTTTFNINYCNIKISPSQYFNNGIHFNNNTSPLNISHHSAPVHTYCT